MKIKMKKIHSVLLRGLALMMSIFSFCCCKSVIKDDDKKAANSLSILSWNIQALFDGEDQGTEYDDYRLSKGWSKEKYEARLNALSKGILALSETPDIIGLIEVENADILEDIASSALKNQGYQWTFFARNPGGALGIGIISKYPFTMAKSHSIISDGEINPRPMAEVRVDVGGQPVVLFVCHWKSKLGDPEITEAQRKASAKLALRRIKELEEESQGMEHSGMAHSSIPIIIMGDLNENHDEFYRTGGNFITALLPDDEDAANLAKTIYGEGDSLLLPQDFLIVTEEKTQQAVYFDYPYNLFYTPWGNELQNGSYVYRKNWETIDHFLLRPSLYDGKGWDFSSCQTITASPFVSAAGNPASYNPRTGWGLSDHLPLLLTMELSSVEE
jgi:endonuclease/exonuclease/phosphatase family metal-dependent hydrolase